MKGYIKLELILEVDSWDFENNDWWFVEDFAREEIISISNNSDLKIVDYCVDWTKYNKWIEEGFEDLF